MHFFFMLTFPGLLFVNMWLRLMQDKHEAEALPAVLPVARSYRVLFKIGSLFESRLPAFAGFQTRSTQRDLTNPRETPCRM